MTTLEYFQAKLDATISPRGVTALRDHRPDSFVIVDVRIGPDQQQNVYAVADTVVGGLFLRWEVLGFCTDR